MRIRIDSKAADGLRVIGEIPPISPCLLEGRNGVGKTICVHLLQLIAGDQPFLGRAASWQSLKARIGRTTVEFSELTDDETMTFAFTPERWPEAPPTEIDDWLGEGTIGGRTVLFQNIADQIAVIRIAGTEDLAETLSRRLATVGAHLEEARDRLAHSRDLVLVHLLPLVTELERADPSQLQEDRRKLEDAEGRLGTALEEAAKANARASALHRAIEARAQVKALGDPANELLARRKTLSKQLNEQSKQRDLLEAQTDALGEKLIKRGDAQGMLADAQRILRHRLKRQTNIATELAEMAAQLEVTPERDAVSSEFAAVTERLKHLMSQRQDLDDSGTVRDVLASIGPPLRQAAAQESVAAQPLIDVRDESVSVGEVASAVVVRTKALTNQPIPSEVHRIDQEIDVARTRARRLRDLVAKLDESDRQADLVTTARQEEAAAVEQAAEAGEVDEAYRAANQELGALQEQIDVLTKQLAQVTGRLGSLGGVSLEDAARNLEEALATLGTIEPELDATGLAIRQEAQVVDQEVAALHQEVAALRRTVQVRATEIDLTIRRLASEARFAWLRKAAAGAVGLPEGEDSIRQYADFRQQILELSRELDDSHDVLDQLLGITRTLDFSASAEQGAQMKQRYRAEFVQVLGDGLRDALSTDAIRRELFDDADIVEVDPVRQEIRLESADGHVTTRPLEAFSTGEQAFAFTQARILDLEPSPRPNRLLVLDEFGAFVSADRLPYLARFLDSEKVHAIADQVVVVLPLHVDYEAEIALTTGALRERYKERLDQIRQRDYCAVPLAQ